MDAKGVFKGISLQILSVILCSICSAQSDPCLRGFTESLPPMEEWDNYQVLDVDGGSFLYPELKFVCDGTLTKITVPYSTTTGVEWDDKVNLDMRIVRLNTAAGGLEPVGQMVRFPDVNFGGRPTANIKGTVELSIEITIKKRDIIQLIIKKHKMRTVRDHVPVLLKQTTEYCASSESSQVPVIQVEFTPSSPPIQECSEVLVCPSTTNAPTILPTATTTTSMPLCTSQTTTVMMNSTVPVNGSQSTTRLRTGEVEMDIIWIAVGTVGGLLLVCVVILLITVCVMAVKNRTLKGKCYKKEGNQLDMSDRRLSTIQDSHTSNWEGGVEEVYDEIEDLSKEIKGLATGPGPPESSSSHFLMEMSTRETKTNAHKSSITDEATLKSQLDQWKMHAGRSSNYQFSVDTQKASKTASTYEAPLKSQLEMQMTDNEFEIYWEPANTIENIYEQLSRSSGLRISKSDLDVQDIVGEGEFGAVYLAFWKMSSKRVIKVAVKTLKDTASKPERVKMLQEAAIMGQFMHPYIVQMYGIVEEPNVMMVMEYLARGSLQLYLPKLSSEIYNGYSQCQVYEKLLRFCQEIANGMRYLSRKGFIHRDLAARNILLTEDYRCKIADFGMSRDIDEGQYYKLKGGRIPLKWTAPEAILYRKYSIKSDVWSYGMVMYEIWSLGCKPFEGFSTEKVVRSLNDKSFLHSPPNDCPRAVYTLMTKCWSHCPENRPAFDVVVQYICNMAATDLYSEMNHSTTGYSVLES